jgi:hypothetical protein
MNDALATAVIGIAGLVGFICFILVLIQMFQRGKTGIAIVCIVLTLCCGLGGLITFIYGWMKAREWNITNIMTIWTIAFAINVVAGALNPAPWRRLQESLQSEMHFVGPVRP